MKPGFSRQIFEKHWNIEFYESPSSDSQHASCGRTDKERHTHTQTDRHYEANFIVIFFFFLLGATSPSGPGPPHYRRFTITFRHTTLDMTPPEGRSARRRDLYLTTHNTLNRQTFMQRGGIRTRNPTNRTAADRAASRIVFYVTPAVRILTINTSAKMNLIQYNA
jgi:hypothetical protein